MIPCQGPDTDTAHSWSSDKISWSVHAVQNSKSKKLVTQLKYNGFWLFQSKDRTSLSLLPLGSKSLPPEEPPSLYGDNAFLKVCTNKSEVLLSWTSGDYSMYININYTMLQVTNKKFPLRKMSKSPPKKRKWDTKTNMGLTNHWLTWDCG